MTEQTKPRFAGWKVAVLTGLHAICWAGAFPPFGLWPLALVSLAPLAVAAIRAERRRTLVLWTFLTSTIGWAALNLWVGEISGAGLPAMAMYLALWTVLAALCIRRLERRRRFRSLPLALLLPIAWLGIEFIRGFIFFDGYPWYLLGQPLIGWLPLAQVADLGGMELVGVLPAAIAGVLADGWLKRGTVSRRRLAAVCTLLLAGLVVGYGLVRVRPLGAGLRGPSMMALQTDVPQSNKVRWTIEQQKRDFISFRDATYAAVRSATAAEQAVDLVIWPETMLPGPGFDSGSIGALEAGGYWPGRRFAVAAMDLVEAIETPMLFGTSTIIGLHEADGQLVWNERYNSMVLVDPADAAKATDALPDIEPLRYDKIFLTPFGETMPYISAWPWLQTQMLAFGARGMTFDLDPGKQIVRFPIEWVDQDGQVLSTSFATPICFEDTVPLLCRDLVWSNGRKVAGLLINASNDGWFGKSDGIRRMHLLAARFRAIENRVPMIRAVNTGISCGIDSSGRVLDPLPSRQTGMLGPSIVRLDDRWTLFSVIGQWPGRSILAILVLMLAFAGVIGGGSPVEPMRQAAVEPSVQTRQEGEMT
jgi:apolipoprotein N-acyltransferase